MVFLLRVGILILLVTPGESIPIGKAVQKLTPEMVGGFFNQVKDLFGSGNSFSKRLGLDYSDVYNNQLLVSIINAFTNHRQQEEEAHQGDLMQKDLNNDYTHFGIEVALLSIITFCVLLITAFKCKEQRDDVKMKERRRLLELFKETEHKKQMKALRDRIAEEVDLD